MSRLRCEEFLATATNGQGRLPNLDAYLGAPLFSKPTKPEVAVREHATRYEVTLQASEDEQQHFDVRLENDALVVQCKAFTKRFLVPNNVDRQAISAIYQNGALRLSLRKMKRPLCSVARMH